MAFSWYKTVTIDHTKVPSTQTDFPVLVSVTDADLKTVGNGGYVQNSSGYDVGFYADSGLATKLDWETERYIATTGEVIYWVRIASLSSSTDTVFYMAFGDPGISTDQSNKTGVWDSNYQTVWHLPDGTTLTAMDSTANANDGFLSGSPTAITGKIGGGANLVAANSQYIQGGNIVNTSDATVEAWVYLTSYPSFDSMIGGFTQGNFSATYDKDLLINSIGKVVFYVYDGSTRTSTSVNSLPLNQWCHVVGTIHAGSSSLRVYINGVLEDTASASGSYTGYSGTPNIFLGGSTLAYGYLDQKADEFRVSASARSSDWITAEYNNQSSPSTFESFGAKTSVGGGGGATQPPRSMHQFRMRRAA